jgi:hypothetical protein
MPREAEEKEFPAVDRTIGDGIAIFPERHKALMHQNIRTTDEPLS